MKPNLIKTNQKFFVRFFLVLNYTERRSFIDRLNKYRKVCRVEDFRRWLKFDIRNSYSRSLSVTKAWNSPEFFSYLWNFGERSISENCLWCFILSVLKYRAAVWHTVVISHFRFIDRVVSKASSLCWDNPHWSPNHRRNIFSLSMLLKLLP